MKSIKQEIALLAGMLMIFSCKKEEIKSPPIASLTLVNAVSGGSSVKMGSFVSAIGLNNFKQFGLFPGDQDIYIWPFGDSLHPYFTYNKFSVQQGDTYSLFLAGTPTAVDGIFIKENIPSRIDSTAGIRFINLAPNKPTINITLSTTPTMNEVSNLGYKQYTDFKTYKGNFNSTYTFQIRDVASGAPATPLATFSLLPSSVPRFANITLVIRQNGANVSVFRINNDR